MTGVLNSVENKFYYIIGVPSKQIPRAKLSVEQIPRARSERITARKHRPQRTGIFVGKEYEREPPDGGLFITEPEQVQAPSRGTSISTRLL